jgi:hypothetical protein
MQKLNPDFFIGAGDIVYYDFPKEASAQTVPQLRKKWHEQFRFPRLVDFLGNTASFWLKDDHDFRFDDADQSGDKLPLASTGMSVFREQMPIHPASDSVTPNYRTHTVSLRYAADKWSVTGGVRNLTDKLYLNAFRFEEPRNITVTSRIAAAVEDHPCLTSVTARELCAAQGDGAGFLPFDGSSGWLPCAPSQVHKVSRRWSTQTSIL